MTNRIVPFTRKDRSWAERTIRRIARDWTKVVFSLHAEDREDERDIDDDMVVEILTKGYVSGDPEKSEHGHVATITKPNMMGTREAGVVCEIWTQEDGLEIITVMWMDLK